MTEPPLPPACESVAVRSRRTRASAEGCSTSDMTVRWWLRKRLAVLVSGVVTAVPVAGCSDASSRAEGPPPHPAPTDFADCNDLAPHRDDGFVVAGSDWSGESHAYGEEETVYACLDPGMGGVVSLVVSGQAIHVRPVRQRIRAFPNGVVPFRVEVDPGGTGSIGVRQVAAASGSGGPGPTVAAGDDGWRFVWDDNH